jgi:phosphoenolpyruvate carboxylase
VQTPWIATAIARMSGMPATVMRKSMIDHRNCIAQLMRLRDLARTETPEGDLIESVATALRNSG